MPFKFCRKCAAMRQFLPNGYDAPRHCDVCGASEALIQEGFLDIMSDYASKWGIDLDRYSERQKRLEDDMDLSLWGMEDATDDIVSKESMSDSFGTWSEDENPPKMTLEQEMEYLKSFGIFDDVLKELGYSHLMDKEMPEQ